MHANKDIMKLTLEFEILVPLDVIPVMDQIMRNAHAAKLVITSTAPYVVHDLKREPNDLAVRTPIESPAKIQIEKFLVTLGIEPANQVYTIPILQKVKTVPLVHLNAPHVTEALTIIEFCVALIHTSNLILKDSVGRRDRKIISKRITSHAKSVLRNEQLATVQLVSTVHHVQMGNIYRATHVNCAMRIAKLVMVEQVSTALHVQKVMI